MVVVSQANGTSTPASGPITMGGRKDNLFAYAEILTCGEDALQPCVMLSVERRAAYGTSSTPLRRYFFDAPEELVRFCGSHQIKLGKLAGVFATTGKGGAGFAELILATGEQGLPSLHLRGPRGTSEYVRALTTSICNPKSTRLLPADATPSEHPVYEDEYVQIWAIPPPVPSQSATQPDGAAPATASSLPPPPPPPPGGPRKRARFMHGGGLTVNGRASVGYRCRFRAGGADLVVLPPGCGSAGLSGPSAEQEGQPGSMVFHMGNRPDGATSNEVGVCDGGRRRGLWKSRERLSRWRALCPSLIPSPPCGVQTENAPLSNGSADKNSATQGSADPVLRAYLHPVARFEAGWNEDVIEGPVQEDAAKECEEWSLHEALAVAEKALREAGSTVDALDGEPELLFLGTGSAKPTSRRGQSAILLRIGDFQALLDCGGGTWAQLVRLLGEAEARAVVNRLALVWISHHHADHCAGLPAVLAQRTVPGIKVVASRQVCRFWRASLDFAGCGVGNAIGAPAISEHKKFTLPQDAGWPASILSVAVPHCPESYAFVLRGESVQVVYSGDCRPSDDLVEAVRAGTAAACTNAADGIDGVRTWLVHEATFNPNEQANAIAVRHSTTTEALDVAARMKATGVLLTHFSQRYPSIALEGSPDSDQGADDDSAGEGVVSEEKAATSAVKSQVPTAGAAFDGLRLWASQMDAFGSARHALETYWSRRFEKTQRERITKPDNLRQPEAGAVIPRACFQAAAQRDLSKTVQSEPAQRVPKEASAETTAVGQIVEKDGLEARLRTFYLRFNPERCSDAPRIARLFSGKEAQLNDKLRARYGTDLPAEGLEADQSSSTSSSDNEAKESKSKRKAAQRMEKAKRKDPPTPPPPPPPKMRLTAVHVPDVVPSLPHGHITWDEDDCPGPAPPQPPGGMPGPPPGLPPGFQPPDSLRKDTRMSTVTTKTNPQPSACDTAGNTAALEVLGLSKLVEPAQRLRRLVAGHGENASKPAPPSIAAERERQVKQVLEAKGGAPPKVDGAFADMEARLRQFYVQHNPEKVGDAANVARVFKGKEAYLNERLRARYDGLDLSSVRLVDAQEAPCDAKAANVVETDSDSSESS
eukprot:TRINITY_DN19138_c0_g1_i1.p1 TRINITY_DN19138_c0_g1~~TRINITY_DN19138_c0_g1_i1.p1  ORF type:complete len:1105 (-),score=140.22 TRINITY_DN19138_c0_g1_i1:474-3788(-)